MKLVPNAVTNIAGKKPYNKPELQVYGNLAAITNNVNTTGGKTFDVKVFKANRTH